MHARPHTTLTGPRACGVDLYTTDPQNTTLGSMTLSCIPFKIEWNTAALGGAEPHTSQQEEAWHLQGQHNHSDFT